MFRTRRHHDLRPHPFRSSVLGALALLLAAPAVAGVRPLGPPAPLDGPTDCGSRDPAITALSGGGFATVWTNGSTLWWRPLDAAGRPLGAAAVVAEGEPDAPEIVGLPGGGFAVVWFDRGLEKVRVRTAGAGGELGTIRNAGDAGAAPGWGFNGLDVATASSGNLAVTWADGGQLYLRELLPDGTWLTPPYSVDFVFNYQPIPVPGPIPAIHDPAILAAPDGSYRFFYVIGGGEPYSEVGYIRALRIGPLLPAGWYGFPRNILVPRTWTDHHPEAAVAADGSYLLAWGTDVGPALPTIPIPPQPGLVALRYPADDDPDDREPQVVDESMTTYGGTAVAALPDGRFQVAWHGTSASEPERPHAFVRTVDAGGVPEGSTTTLAPPESWGQEEPALAAAAGVLVAAWGEVQDPDIVFVRCPGEQVRVRPFQSTCAAGGTACVAEGRFEMSLTFSDPRRGIPLQAAKGAQLTADTAYFWFGAADNVEVVAKILDGQALNGHFWVFYGGLTDLGFELEVVDNVTGNRRVFTNPPGTMASAGVTDALPAPAPASGASGGELAPVQARRFTTAALVRDALPASGEATGLGVVGATAGAGRATSLVDSAAGPCSPPELPVVPRPGLCLNDRQFEVEVDWKAFDGTTGAGEGVALGDDSGYFWFFATGNVEMVTKVLDARAINGHFWVFYGALTNVEYDILVRHVSGAPEARYHNPSGEFGSVGDVDALPSP